MIASDKTGTLTQNVMTVEQFYQDGQVVSAGDFQLNEANLLTLAMLLANDSKQTEDGLVGDPTETALVQYYLDRGMAVANVIAANPRRGIIPFDSERKLMSIIVDHDGQPIMYTKGAVDELLARATTILDHGEVRPLTQADKEAILVQNEAFANQALRVLAYAVKPLEAVPTKPASDQDERGLTFVGLTGMIDPERPEVAAAIKEAHEAGIRTLMITGDHRVTATAIAKRLGLLIDGDGQRVITGSELDQMSEAELDDQVESIAVYARVAPEHTVRIVNAWQRKGKVVAMTGDGVNDAPALKAADIGVGMGITGTEVSKNAADIVLADDNFATIIAAVREGRKVFANIQKAVQYLLSANLGEVFTLAMMTFLNWTIFAPVQILWINLVTDTFPAIALGVEEADQNAMHRPPRGKDSNLLSNGVGFNIVYQGLIEGLLTLGVYLFATTFPYHQSSAAIHADALTMAYATLGLIQLFHAFNCKHLTESVFSTRTFDNRFFNWALLASAILLACTIFVPGLNDLFHVTNLAPAQWCVVLIAGILMILIVEIVKAVQRSREN